MPAGQPSQPWGAVDGGDIGVLGRGGVVLAWVRHKVEAEFVAPGSRPGPGPESGLYLAFSPTNLNVLL